MIVKIQRPIMSTEAEPPCLVYDKRRKFEANMPLTPEIAALFKGGELKIYHHAEVRGEQLLIGDRVKDQDF